MLHAVEGVVEEGRSVRLEKGLNMEICKQCQEPSGTS